MVPYGIILLCMFFYLSMFVIYSSMPPSIVLHKGYFLETLEIVGDIFVWFEQSLCLNAT